MKGGLSASMRLALSASLSGNNGHVDQRTANALQRRGLWTDERTLTRDGWLLAVANAPLNLQAKQLNLRVEILKILSRGKRPEITAFEHYVARGFTGSYCEGGALLLLIKSACLDFLFRINSFGCRKDAIRRFTEAQLHIHADKIQDICNEIEVATTGHLEKLP